MGSYEYSFTWHVSHENRNMLKMSWSYGESFASKHFCSNEDIWWNLCFYPLGDTDVKKEVVIRLCRENAGREVYVKGVIVLSMSFAKNRKFRFRYNLSKTEAYIRVPLYKSLIDMYEYYPPHLDLEVTCNFNVIEKFDEKPDKKPSKDITPTKSECNGCRSLAVKTAATDFQYLSYNLESMYRSKQFCDVTLRSGRFELIAHMNILSSRSQKFAELFSHLSSNNLNNVVKLDRIDGDVLEEMVFFMYTGRTNKLNYEMAKDLLSAAEKYDLEDLQQVCSSHLISELSVDSVMDILVFADEYSNEELRKKSMEFLSSHFKQIKKTDRWMSFINDQPSLGVKVLSIMMDAIQ